MNGTPLTVTCDTNTTDIAPGTYYYATNVQEDIVAILDGSGNKVVGYTYDAWGNTYITHDETTGLGTYNPLRYRGYVYDQETSLYYLQSRYYDPKIGRFINADGVITTGQGIIGSNMFTYCSNNPVRYIDRTGHAALEAVAAYISSVAPYVISGAIAGGLMGVASYLISIGFDETAFIWKDFWESVGMGMLSGAVGGLAGPASSTAKTIISAIAGIIPGIYSGVNADGSNLNKILVGISTTIITACATYAGAKIDVSTTSAIATAFANYCVSIVVGMQAELSNLGMKKVINDIVERIDRIVAPSFTANAQIATVRRTSQSFAMA